MSNKLNLNFVEIPMLSPFNVTALGVIIFLASLALAIYTLEIFKASDARNTALELELNQKHTNIKPQVRVSSASIDIAPEEKSQIKETIATLIIPWDGLMNAIETADTKDVALLGIEPNTKKQLVVLTGEARNLKSIMSYINRLEESTLSRVYLQKHTVDEVNAFKPVKFSVVAHWQVLGD